MAKRETYYYTFYYVDGTNQEFSKDDNMLSSAILNASRQRVQVDNVLINLDNVIKVTVETETEREEKRKIAKKQADETIEALSRMNF